MGLIRPRGIRTIDRSVPTELLETLLAHIRYSSVGSFQAPTEDGTSHARRPCGVAGRVAHRGRIVAVHHNRVAFAGVVARIEGGDVAVEGVGGVGDVDDEWRHGRGVGRVAAEEGGAGVQA